LLGKFLRKIQEAAAASKMPIAAFYIAKQPQSTTFTNSNLNTQI